MGDVKSTSAATTSRCFQGDRIFRAPGHEPFEKKKGKRETNVQRAKRQGIFELPNMTSEWKNGQHT